MIARRNPHINHFDFGQLLQHSLGRQPWGVEQETLLQSDLQAVGEKGNQNVRVGAMFQLVVDGAEAQFALERPEYRFNLGQLTVRSASSGRWDLRRSGWSAASSVRYAIPPPGLFLIHSKLEGFPRDLPPFLRYLQMHKMECATRWGFRGAQTHQQLDQRGQASPHGAKSLEQASQTRPAPGRLLLIMAKMPRLLVTGQGDRTHNHPVTFAIDITARRQVRANSTVMSARLRTDVGETLMKFGFPPRDP